MSEELISKYKIGETIQINFGLGRYIKEAIIKSIAFTESKVYYDVSFEYDNKIVFYLDNLDSCLIENLYQKEPNQFAKIEDIKKLIDNHKYQIDILNKMLEL